MAKYIYSLICLLLTLCTLVHGSYFSVNRPVKKTDPLNRRQAFLQFNNVITNSDASFLPDFGAFSAPQDGHYYFSLCIPKSGRRSKFAMYKFTLQDGPEKIITLKPRNSNKCVSLILNLKRGEFVYNVLLNGNFGNNRQDFVFTGHLLPDNSVVTPKISRRGKPRFPFSEAIPKNAADDSGEDNENGRPNPRLPFVRG